MAPKSLPDLPLEIILDVTDCLAPRSTICLALTCKKLYNTKRLRDIWTRGFDSKKNHCGCRQDTSQTSTCPPLPLVNHEKYLFLQILARDLPDRQLCDSCQCFHHPHETPAGEPWLGTWCLPRTCGWTTVRGRVFELLKLRYQLHFSDAQWVMNRHRRGEASLSMLPRIFTDWHSMEIIHRENYEETRAPIDVQLMVDYRIVSGCLLIHSRQRMFVSSAVSQAADMPWAHEGSGVCVVLKVCPHAESKDKIKTLTDMTLTDMGLDSPNKQTSVVGYRIFPSKGTNQCTSCLTEFSFKLEHREDESYEMVAESWTNLGPCEWNHQPSWQAATSDKVMPDRFIIYRNTSPVFETFRSLGYPSEHDCHLTHDAEFKCVRPEAPVTDTTVGTSTTPPAPTPPTPTPPTSDPLPTTNSMPAPAKAISHTSPSRTSLSYASSLATEDEDSPAVETSPDPQPALQRKPKRKHRLKRGMDKICQVWRSLKAITSREEYYAWEMRKRWQSPAC